MHVCPPSLRYLLETGQRASMQAVGWLKRKIKRQITESQSGWSQKTPLEIVSATLYPSKSIFTYRKFPRIVFSQVLDISTDKDTTTSLRNLFQCSHTLIVSECLLMFRQNSVFQF